MAIPKSKKKIAETIKEAANLDWYGRGYTYSWTIHRDGDTIENTGAKRLYRTAQKGDKIDLAVLRAGRYYVNYVEIEL